MGGHSCISQTSYGTPVVPVIPPPPPVPDYNVTGDPVPDCKCNYFLEGTYTGRPYYRRADGLFFIYWTTPGFWTITSLLGIPSLFGWWKADDPVTGLYAPLGTASGNPLVSAGGH